MDGSAEGEETRQTNSDLVLTVPSTRNISGDKFHCQVLGQTQNHVFSGLEQVFIPKICNQVFHLKELGNSMTSGGNIRMDFFFPCRMLQSVYITVYSEHAVMSKSHG